LPLLLCCFVGLLATFWIKEKFISGFKRFFFRAGSLNQPEKSIRCHINTQLTLLSGCFSVPLRP
jgi:hypothetical protein